MTACKQGVCICKQVSVCVNVFVCVDQGVSVHAAMREYVCVCVCVYLLDVDAV